MICIVCDCACKVAVTLRGIRVCEDCVGELRDAMAVELTRRIETSEPGTTTDKAAWPKGIGGTCISE